MLRTWSLMSVLLLSAPAMGQLNTGGTRWNVQDQVNFSLLRSGFQSQIKTQEMIEIPNESAFHQYWQRAFGQPGANAPKDVDWRKEKLLAVHLGTRNTSGFSVMIQNVEKKGSFAMVTAVETQPSRGQMVAQNITSPFTIIKVDRIVVPFRLEIKKKEGLSVPGGSVIWTTPGTAIINPQDYERPGGGGYVDPKLQVEWGYFGARTRSQAVRSGLTTLNSESQWGMMWANLTGEPARYAPTGVNWAREQLVVLMLGTRDTTGYSVKVLGVEKTGRGTAAVVRALEEGPVPGSTVRRRKTSPFVVIRVARGAGPFSVDLVQRERGPGTVRIIEDDGRDD